MTSQVVFYKANLRPKIVCLCGSTRFMSHFLAANADETLKGNIVLSVGFFGHMAATPIDAEVKEKLDELHKRKIDLADEVFFLNVGGYIGDSTRSELAYAIREGKTIRFLEPQYKYAIEGVQIS